MRLAKVFIFLLAMVATGCGAINQGPSFSYYSVTPTKDEDIKAVRKIDLYHRYHDIKLPPFLMDVCPPPGITMTLAEYDYLANYGMGGICVDLDLTQIEVEYLPLDFDELDEYLKNASLKLNGKKVNWDEALRWLTTSGREISLKGFKSVTPGASISPEVIEAIEFGFGDVKLLWSPKLTYGLYQAVFEISSSYGETFSYSWEFTIIED